MPKNLGHQNSLIDQGHEISRNKGQVQTIDFPVMNTTKNFSFIVTASTCLCRLLLQMFAAVQRVPWWHYCRGWYHWL